jgi:ornithine cyclodeaminase/alanine dehydrogenase-like protein (mu-crystallin family)
MNSPGGGEKTLLLSRRDISDLISLEDCIRVVEDAFRMYSEGRSLKPEMMHVDSVDGEFHVKGGDLELQKRLFGLKINGDFPGNPDRFGMPSLHGVIILCSVENGYPSPSWTPEKSLEKRTGAATAVAAKYLANPNSGTVTICGCGAQWRMQFRALARVLPIRRVLAFSRIRIGRAFAAGMCDDIGSDGDVVDFRRTIRPCSLVQSGWSCIDSDLPTQWDSPQLSWAYLLRCSDFSKQPRVPGVLSSPAACASRVD